MRSSWDSEILGTLFWKPCLQALILKRPAWSAVVSLSALSAIFRWYGILRGIYSDDFMVQEMHYSGQIPYFWCTDESAYILESHVRNICLLYTSRCDYSAFGLKSADYPSQDFSGSGIILPTTYL